jgi:hypothetical protein
MKHFILSILAVFILAFSASATVITVGAYDVTTTWTFGGSTATIRIYSTRTFITSTGSTVTQGYATGFYKTINCIVASTTVSCPSFTIDSTTDSSIPSSKYIAEFYDSTGRSRGRYMEQFTVPTSLGTSVTWAQLRIYNTAPLPITNFNYYSTTDIDSFLAGKQDTLVNQSNIKSVNGTSLLGSGNVTITGTAAWGGITGTLSSQTDLQTALNAKQVTLISATNIKTINGNSVLGSGNLTISGGGGGGVTTLANTYGNSLATAISTIGSTPTTLLVDQDTTVTTGLTTPSTLTLRFENDAKITLTSTASLVFQGQGLADPVSAKPALVVPTLATVETRDFYMSSVNDTLTRAGHGFIDGQRARLVQTIGTPAGGLTDGTAYYIHVLDSARIQFATSYANAIAGIVIDITSGGSGGQQGFLYGESLGWSGSTTPTNVSTEIIDTGTNSVTDRLRVLRSAFWTTNGVTFVAYPRPITSYVIFRDNQSVFFKSGNFLNTYAPVDSVADPFWMSNNSRFSSEGSARIYSSTGTENNCSIVTTNGSPTRHVAHVVIENNYFTDGGAIDLGGNQTVAVLYECDYCTIRNNRFDGIHSYHAGVVGNRQNLTDLIPQYDTIEGNTSLNHVSQLYYVISGKHIRILNNNVFAATAPAYPQAAIFDLEPNTQYDQIEDVEIAGNYIDWHDYAAIARGIEVQSTYTTYGTHGVKIHNNTLIGGVPNGVAFNSPSLIQIDQGASDIEIDNNRLEGAGFDDIGVNYSRRVLIHDNQCVPWGGVSRVFLASVAESQFYRNNCELVNESDEQFQFIGSDGTGKVDLVYPDGSPEGGGFPWFVGLKVFFNETEYTIATITDNTTDLFVRHITTTPTFPLNIASQTVASTSVNTATDEITTPANHLLVSGDIVRLSPTGGSTVPGGLPGNNYYYVIKTANNKFKLADTHAHALAGTAIDLTSQGSGNVVYQIGWFMRFTAIDYSDNTIATSFLLNPTSFSQILSTSTDKKVTNVADANHTSTYNTGIVCFGTRTAGRTENLPTAVGIQGKEIVVKDCSGQAATFNITIDGNGAETIDGAATKVISTNYGSARVKSNGIGWFTY